MSRKLAAVAMIVPLCILLAASADTEEESPHGSPTGCSTCHEPVARGTALQDFVWVGGSSDAACLECHEPGPHDVGMEPYGGGEDADEYATLPEGWPLVDGTLACLTCHDEPACDGLPLEPDNHRFYRGGPVGSVGEFCARCHTVEQWGSYNPHEVMEERPDMTSVCEFCHQSATVTEADMDDLRVAGPRMCAGCHREPDIHASAAEHHAELDAAAIARADAAGLPLDEGKVYCGTCHDPHPAGSIDQNQDRVGRLGRELMPPGWADAVLGQDFARRGEERGVVVQARTTEADYLRLPLEGGDLCKVCHLAEDTDAASGEPEP